MNIDTIVFDLGAVLIDWNPRYLYRKIFNKEEDVEWFLANVCTSEWNEEQDAGRSFEEAVRIQTQKFPQFEKEIEAYWKRWPETMGDAIDGTVKIFDELKSKGSYKFYALTNWSGETIPYAFERFRFFEWFDGIVVSGNEKVRKPFPELYHRMLNRYNINPAKAFFIDDNIKNIEVAHSLNINAVQFTSPDQLREELISRELL